MVTIKHCCYGDCRSDSQKLETKRDIYLIGFGNGFPKPNKETEKCQRWVHNCGRKLFTIHDINKALKVLWDGTHGMGGKRWSTVPIFGKLQHESHNYFK